eukprot:11624289-Alexandrium_andersonii.AAC.1
MRAPREPRVSGGARRLRGSIAPRPPHRGISAMIFQPREVLDGTYAEYRSNRVANRIDRAE